MLIRKETGGTRRTRDVRLQWSGAVEIFAILLNKSISRFAGSEQLAVLKWRGYVGFQKFYFSLFPRARDLQQQQASFFAYQALRRRGKSRPCDCWSKLTMSCRREPLSVRTLNLNTCPHNCCSSTCHVSAFRSRAAVSSPGIIRFIYFYLFIFPNLLSSPFFVSS